MDILGYTEWIGTLGLYNVSNTQNMPAHREGAPAIEDTSHIADTTNEGWVHVDIASVLLPRLASMGSSPPGCLAHPHEV